MTLARNDRAGPPSQADFTAGGYPIHSIPDFSKMRSVLLFLGTLLTACICHSAFGQTEFEIENAFPNLTFPEQPVDLAADGEGFLYVVDKFGKIYAFENDSTTTEHDIFLDLSDRVYVDNEAGLLSIAFHPDYSDNGYFYIYYVVQDPLRSVLSRMSRSDTEPLRADLESELVLLEIDQPTDRHNAGETAFGPDGYLYLSLGDGSRGGDAYENGQNLHTLLGSIIRIDVDNPSDGRNYGIPPDNPFVGNIDGYKEEIYAYGFRNPWRFSIERETGHLWVGDVGETSWEEVDFVVKGGNYGWPIMEGPSCFDPPSNCSDDGLYGPIWATNHDTARSVIAGYVYEGDRVPELRGKLIFADWNESRVWSLTYDGDDPYKSNTTPVIEQIADSTSFISSFGIDEKGELYMLYTFWQTVMRFKSTGTVDAEPPAPPEDRSLTLAIEGPNPFHSRTELSLTARQTSRVSVQVYDILGREVAVLFDGVLADGDARSIYLEGESLPSGLYFVRAASNGKHVVRKLIRNR